MVQVGREGGREGGRSGGKGVKTQYFEVGPYGCRFDGLGELDTMVMPRNKAELITHPPFFPPSFLPRSKHLTS